MTDIETLISDLSSPDRVKRSDAVWRLLNLSEGEAKPIEAVPSLRLLLDDLSEPCIRMSAAGAILAILGKDDQALAVLIDSMDDPHQAHCATVCEFLGKANDPNNPAVLLLLKSLLNDDELYANAADAITEITGDLTYSFEGALKQLGHFEDELTRCVGREHLLFLGRNHKEIIPMLRDRLNSLQWDARLEAEEILHLLKNA